MLTSLPADRRHLFLDNLESSTSSAARSWDDTSRSSSSARVPPSLAHLVSLARNGDSRAPGRRRGLRESIVGGGTCGWRSSGWRYDESGSLEARGWGGRRGGERSGTGARMEQGTWSNLVQSCRILKRDPRHPFTTPPPQAAATTPLRKLDQPSFSSSRKRGDEPFSSLTTMLAELRPWIDETSCSTTNLE